MTQRKPYREINWHPEALTPTWFNQLQHAKALYEDNPEEVLHYAMVSFTNDHFCHECFCCACLVIYRNQGQLQAITGNIKRNL